MARLSSNDTQSPFRDGTQPVDLAAMPGGHGQKRNLIATARIAADIYCGIEITTVFLVGLAVGEIHVRGVLGIERYLDLYIWPLLLLPLTYAILAHRARMYETATLGKFALYSAKAIVGLVGAFFTIAAVAIMLGVTDDYSRLWFGTWLLASVLALWLLRAVAARTFSHWNRSGILKKQVAIVGSGRPLAELLQNAGHDESDMNVVRVFRVAGTGAVDVERACSNLVAFSRNIEPESVIIALPANFNDVLPEIVLKLGVLPSEIKLYPGFAGKFINLHGVSSLGSAQFVDLQRRPADDWGQLGKKIEDYVIAATALVLLSPLMLLIAAAIKLDSRGPVIFRQKRGGLNDQVFEMFKFRTMKVDGKGEFRQATANDDRVTRLGRLLRRTSLDELPQLLNVLRGDMSIVGPRPHPVELNRHYSARLPLYDRRHRVKPGITGWAQINDHRGPTNSEQMLRRLQCDLYYIDNWSIWLDFSIIAATPLISVIHKNAV